jgi:hypothetical protein
MEREHEEDLMSELTTAARRDLPPATKRIVQELVDERLDAWCDVVVIAEQTWAIRGSIAYEGEVILAEFDSRDLAVLALEELAARSPGVTIR